MNVGRLQRVPLREVWRHEAYDFTVWLQDNLDVLNDVLGVSLVSAEREQAAGSFNVDLLAEDSAGNPVIIENQLESSDHDHLGKVLTYLVAFDASMAIWIVSEPRPEHVAAVQWLNQASSGSFFLVKVEAVRIGESDPAPLLTEIVGPSEEAREIGETKREFSERHHIREDFWTSLLERINEKTSLFANISPSRDSWIGTGAGTSGVSYNFVVLQHEARVELWIAKRERDENKAVYDFLSEHKSQIEEKFGGDLDWQRMEEAKASRVAHHIYTGGYRDENWDETQEAMIAAMVRLEAALRSYIAQLRV